MNNARRKIIQKAICNIESVLQDVLGEEQEAFDNMPENLQDSERGQISQDAQENLEAAIEALEEAISCLEEIE